MTKKKDQGQRNRYERLHWTFLDVAYPIQKSLKTYDGKQIIMMEEDLEKIITILDSACLKIFDDTLQTILLCDASLKVMGEALL